MNKKEKLEIIMEQIKSVQKIRFTDIDGWNELDLKSQKEIIKEWTICTNPDYQISIIKDNFMNTEEPVTASRISRELNFTYVTSRILEERYLELTEDDVDKFERDLYSSKLVKLVDAKINEQNITGDRKKLLLEETEGICKLGNPKLIIVAYKITSMLKQKKFCWFIRGNLASSLLAYHLGIHDIDCYENGIDYRICHGIDFKTNFSIDLTVSQIHQAKICQTIENEVLNDEKIYKIFFRTKSNMHIVHTCRMVIPLEHIDSSFIMEVEDASGVKQPCIWDKDLYGTLKDKLIKINIFAGFGLNFLEMMNKVEPIHNINTNDVKYLNIALRNKNKFVFSGDKFELLSKLNKEPNFDDYINWLGYLLNIRSESLEFNDPRIGFSSRDDMYNTLKPILGIRKALMVANSTKYSLDCLALEENVLAKLDKDILLTIKNTFYLWPKACLIEQIYHKIRLAYYFIKYPDESFGYYFRNFFDVNVSKNMLNAKNEYEHLRLLTYMDTYHFYSFDRYIGIFFVIDGKLVTYKEKLIKTSNEFIDVDKGHFELFNTLPISSDFEYSMFPRGRILYNNKEHCFYVYGDKTILKDEILLDKISKEFNLPRYNIKFKGDEHYKTLRY